MDDMQMLQKAIELFTSGELKTAAGGGTLGTILVALWEHILDLPLAALQAKHSWIQYLRFSQYNKVAKFFASSAVITLTAFVVILIAGSPFSVTTLLSAISVAMAIHHAAKSATAGEPQTEQKPLIAPGAETEQQKGRASSIVVPLPKLPPVGPKPEAPEVPKGSDDPASN